MAGEPLPSAFSGNTFAAALTVYLVEIWDPGCGAALCKPPGDPTELCFKGAMSLSCECASFPAMVPRFKLHSISFLSLHTEASNSHSDCHTTHLDIISFLRGSLCSKFFPSFLATTLTDVDWLSLSWYCLPLPATGYS